VPARRADGHLVISTAAHERCLSCVVRLIDMGIEPFHAGELDSARRRPAARAPAVPALQRPAKNSAGCGGNRAQEALLETPDLASVVFLRGARGAIKCSRTGYSGRKAIFEVYKINAAMRDHLSLRRRHRAACARAAEEAGCGPCAPADSARS